jgi:hypothetical protein
MPDVEKGSEGSAHTGSAMVPAPRNSGSSGSDLHFEPVEVTPKFPHHLLEEVISGDDLA